MVIIGARSPGCTCAAPGRTRGEASPAPRVTTQRARSSRTSARGAFRAAPLPSSRRAPTRTRRSRLTRARAPFPEMLRAHLSSPLEHVMAQAQPLNGLKVAILATDGFEQSELTEPRHALDEAGADTEVISPKPGTVRGWKMKEWGDEVEV